VFLLALRPWNFSGFKQFERSTDPAVTRAYRATTGRMKVA
jgi:hypothetical protein